MNNIENHNVNKNQENSTLTGEDGNGNGETELQAALDEFLRENPEPVFEELVLEEPPQKPVKADFGTKADYFEAIEKHSVLLDTYNDNCEQQKTEYEQRKNEALKRHADEKRLFLELFKQQQEDKLSAKNAELEEQQKEERKQEKRKQIVAEFNSFNKEAFVAEKNRALEGLTEKLGELETQKRDFVAKKEKSEKFLNDSEKLKKYDEEDVQELKVEFEDFLKKIEELDADILEKQNEQEKIREEINGADQKHNELFEEVKEMVLEECLFNYDAMPFKVEKPQDEYLGNGVKIYLTGEGHVNGEPGRLAKGMPDNLYEILAKYNFGSEQKKLILTAIADKLQDDIKERALEQSGLGKEKKLLKNAKEKINNRLEGIKSAKEDVGYLLLAYLRERMPEAELEKDFLYNNSRDKKWLHDRTHGEWVFDEIASSLKSQNGSKFKKYLYPGMNKRFGNGLYEIMAVLSNDKLLYDKIVIAPSPENLRVVLDALEGAPGQKELIDQYKAWGDGQTDYNDFPEAKQITVEDSYYTGPDKNPSALCHDKLDIHSYSLERGGNVVDLSMEELAAMGIKPNAQKVKQNMDSARINYARNYSISIDKVTDQMLFTYNKFLDLSKKSTYELMNEGYYSQADLQKISSMYKEKYTSQSIISDKERTLDFAIRRTKISSNLDSKRMSEETSKLVEVQLKPKEYEAKTGQTREQFAEEFSNYNNEKNIVDSFEQSRTLEKLKRNIDTLTPAIDFFVAKGYNEPVKIFLDIKFNELILSFDKAQNFIKDLRKPLDEAIAIEDRKYISRNNSLNPFGKQSDLDAIARKISSLKSERESLNNEIYAATREFSTDGVGSMNTKLVGVNVAQNAEIKAVMEKAGVVSPGFVKKEQIKDVLNKIAIGLEASLAAKKQSIEVKKTDIENKQAIWNEINQTK